jgi:phosphatidylinositol alpha-1,6-mannosyltransferase
MIIGRLDPANYKGHDDLVAIWPAVCRVYPQAELHIVGTGSYASALKKHIDASEAADKIIMRGFVPEADMDALWADTAVFAMPSRGEGFGLVYIEAMRHGVPVVASTADAAQEICRHGVTGLNIAAGDREALLQALLNLLGHSEQRLRLGQSAREHWATHFAYSSFRDRWRTSLYDFVLQS